jgi:rod shape-determining protein MreD
VSDRRVIRQFASEPSALRRALVAATLPVALFAAVVLQLTVVNLLPLPGGDAPDLMLLLVTAVAVASDPMTGALTGFAGGLAMDVAPPVTHYAGEYALVFCLAGYLAAQAVAVISAAAGGTGRDPAIAMAVMAVAAAAGEAGKAALGLLLAAPEVTWPAIKHALPGAAGYDLLLVPVAYWLVSRVAGLARPAQERAPAPVFVGAQRLAAVFRSASAGAAPNLRLAGSGAKFAAARPPRREPRLRLAEQKSNSLARTYGGSSTTAQFPLAGGRAAKLHFARSARLHATNLHAAAGSAPTRLARPGRTPKINFATDRPTSAPRRQRGPGKGWLRARTVTARTGTGRTGTAQVTAARVTAAGGRSPSAGWLRTDRHRPPAAVRRATPGKGWLRTAPRRRANWYSNGPTTGWVRRSRAKDRWRTRRRSLSGSLVSAVRDLLPTGGRR